MKYSEIREAVVNVALSGHVPFVRGLHGIGKSEMMANVAKTIGEKKGMEVSFHAIDTSHIKEGELTGMPITGKDSKTGCMVNTYTTYNLFNQVIKEEKEGKLPVIFFDEINRADRVVFNELMPIILNKRVQETNLPENTVILAAGNPEDITKYKGANDDYSVLPMDPALKDRFFIFELDVDPIEWLSWAKNNIHEDITAFIAEMPKNLHFLSNAEINPTPRAWKMFSDVYSLLLKDKSFESVEDEVILLGSGKIGKDTVVSFVRFMKEAKNPLLKVKDFFGEAINEKIFEDNLKKLKAETPTRCFVTMENITKYFLEEMEKDSSKKKSNDILIKKYMDILWSCPRDILIGTLKDFLENHKKVLNSIVKVDAKRIIEAQKYLT